MHALLSQFNTSIEGFRFVSEREDLGGGSVVLRVYLVGPMGAVHLQVLVTPPTKIKPIGTFIPHLKEGLLIGESWSCYPHIRLVLDGGELYITAEILSFHSPVAVEGTTETYDCGVLALAGFHGSCFHDGSSLEAHRILKAAFETGENGVDVIKEELMAFYS